MAHQHDKPLRFFGTEPDKMPLGTYRFKVGNIKPEKHYKKMADGTPMAIVPLLTETDEATGYTSATFFFKPNSLQRVADFVEIVTGSRPALDAISTSTGFKAQLEKCVKRHLIATVQMSKPNKAGKVYVNVSDFKPDTYDATQASPGAAAASEPEPDDLPY